MATPSTVQRWLIALLVFPLVLSQVGVGSTASAAASRRALEASVRRASRSAAESRTDYSAAFKTLEDFIAHEMADKELPAVSIALVDDQTDRLGARASASPTRRRRCPPPPTPSTASAPCRSCSPTSPSCSSSSRAKLDLDAPVTRYLPDFRPRNPFGKPITLRQLMSHRSGLVREPPVGHYFDPTEPSLGRDASRASTTRSSSTRPKRAPSIPTRRSPPSATSWSARRGSRSRRTCKRAVLDPLGMKNAAASSRRRR